MSDRYCPLHLIAIAADVDGRLTNDPIGADCDQSRDCAWWTGEECAIVALAKKRKEEEK